MSGQTYADLLASGSTQLRAAGLEDGLREARRLMLLASGLEPAQLIANETDRVAAAHLEAYLAMLQMRVDRTPFAHIAGEVSFFGLTLRADSRALIPRADSETVVALALECIPEKTALQVADLGTGSGALITAILAQRPLVRGIAVENDPNAILLAIENFETTKVARRVDLFEGTWSEWAGWPDCDLILSNPPYINRDVIAQLEPEVRDFDPRAALDGGPDGLAAYREIIGLASEQMKPGAHLVFESGFDQKRAVSNLLLKAGFTDLRYRQDLGGHDRAIAALKT